MFGKKKIKKYDFEKVLDAFIKYKKDYCIEYTEKDGQQEILIESKIKPSKPSKRQAVSLETSKTKETTKKD